MINNKKKKKRIYANYTKRNSVANKSKEKKIDRMLPMSGDHCCRWKFGKARI